MFFDVKLADHLENHLLADFLVKKMLQSLNLQGSILQRSQFPGGSTLYKDTGYQGYEPAGVNTRQPKKKPHGGELTQAEKEQNSLISSVRIIVEHVICGIKRCRIVKDVFRNTKDKFDDLVMEIACGLHNFRRACRTG